MSELRNNSSTVAWTNAMLYCPFQHSQTLLYEHASILSTRAFLHMLKLPYNLEERPNCEFMSPNGVVPFLRLDTTLVTGFSDIVDYVAHRNVQLTHVLSESEVADMSAYMELIMENLITAEMYFCWKNSQTYNEVTRHRYGSVYLFPLNWILPNRKRRQMLTYLKNIKWSQLTLEEVVKKCDQCFKALSLKLDGQNYMMGSKPTELDALAFGHIYSILTTELPSNQLANTINQYENLLRYCRLIDIKYFKV